MSAFAFDSNFPFMPHFTKFKPQVSNVMICPTSLQYIFCTRLTSTRLPSRSYSRWREAFCLDERKHTTRHREKWSNEGASKNVKGKRKSCWSGRVMLFQARERKASGNSASQARGGRKMKKKATTKVIKLILVSLRIYFVQLLSFSFLVFFALQWRGVGRK